MNLLKQSQDPSPSPTVHDELETQQKLHCRKHHLSFTDVSAKLLVTVSDLGVGVQSQIYTEVHEVVYLASVVKALSF